MAKVYFRMWHLNLDSKDNRKNEDESNREVAKTIVHKV
jgi:hypothetical protein